MASSRAFTEKICKFLVFSEKTKTSPKKSLDSAILARARQ
jgi:hypothetical protein